MFLHKKRFKPGLHILAYSGLAILFVLAIALRVSLYHIVTSDYTIFLSQWYDFISTHGGFAALKYNFSNYNPPYHYLIALTTYLPIPELVAIKTLSVLFDGALVILSAPTIVINSAAWGNQMPSTLHFAWEVSTFSSKNGQHGPGFSSA